MNVDTEVGEMYNFWNVYPVTDQSPFLDEQQFGQLRQTYRYAKYINCVRLLGGIDPEKDDYFRGIDDQGEAVCDFSEGLAMLAGIRRCGFTPWIVLDNVPAEMSENPTQNRYERNAAMEEAHATSGGKANRFAIAMKVMQAHRAEYERLSKLDVLDPLPSLNIDRSGRLHFDVTMDGHAVMFLRLE